MSEGKREWIIAVPRQKGKDMVKELQNITKDSAEAIHQFNIPDLRVGNIDSLISLSDELRKLDAHVESTTRKIVQQYDDLSQEIDQAKGKLEVKGVSPQAFLNKFKWDDQRFSKRKPLPDLSQIIEVGVAKMDAEHRAKATEYSSLEQKLHQVKSSAQGNLLTRDLTKDIAPKRGLIQETKNLASIFVVVPSVEVKAWHACYESLHEFVVPRSCVVIKEENDFSLMMVVLMKRAVEPFKNKCREKRFTVRKYDPTATMSDEDFTKLQRKFEKAQRHLLRWSMTNFGEAFYFMTHLKCIQCYVESILRFGLPADFEAMLITPRKNHESKLESLLCKHYSYIGRDFGTTADEDDYGFLQEKFFPYVFSEVAIDFEY